MEHYTPVYVNFINFEKAFNSVDQKLLYGIQGHIIQYQDMQCQVLHQGHAQESFMVLTGVKQQPAIKKDRQSHRTS